MKQLYDGQIHGSYFPVGRGDGGLTRIQTLLRLARRQLPGTVSSVIDIGPESLSISTDVIRTLGISPDIYTCVDLSAAVVRAMRMGGLRALELDLSCQAIDSVPDGTVGLVLMSEVIEHMIDPDHALREIRRILKPDGILALSTPNLASLLNRLMLLAGLQPAFTETGTEWIFGRGPLHRLHRPVGHLRLLTSRALIELLNYHGFQCLAFQGLPVPEYIPLPRLARWFDSVAARKFSLASDLVVIARPS